MQFRIEQASGRAVYQQIMDQVKRDIALGKIIEGERLPTVRELAGQLAINPNTIGKAYRQLEQEGIIVTRPGAGAFIANLDSQLSGTVKRKLISEELERIVVDAYHMQVDKETLKKWFNEAARRFKLSGKQER
jgi:GntR family transcriptional regulator